MKPNTQPAAEKRDHIEKPWNYEDEAGKIYSGQDMAEIIRDAEQAATAAAVTDLVRVRKPRKDRQPRMPRQRFRERWVPERMLM